METLAIVNNRDRQRFETLVEGDYAYIDYRTHHGQMILMHTFVPEKLRGRKIADQLAKFALEYVQKEKIDVKIYCPFVTKYVQRHPELSTFVPKLITSVEE